MRPCFVSLLLFALISSCTPSFRKLHRQAVVIDTHNDVLSQVTLRGLGMEQDLTGQAHTDLARFEKGGMDIQVFSIFYL